MAQVVSGERLRGTAQEVPGVVVYPGTEIMTDVADVHLKHAGKHTLVPQPTNDPNDPLNWSRTWKWLTMSSMALCTFNYGVGPLSLAPQVPYYMRDFDSSLPAVINFVGVSILILGFTNFIWVPLSRGLGRRPVAIITTLITMASCIWRARATSYNSFLGASIFCGIGASPGETLGPIIIADISFLHERGRWMGLYQWSFWSGLMIGPILAGVTSQDYGWQSFWWVCTAISAFTIVWIMFFLPETKWDRRGPSATSADTQAQASESSLKEDALVTKTERVDGVEHARSPASYTDDSLEERISGKPNKTQMLPIVGWKAHEPVLEAIILPLKLARFPIVLWGAIQFTLSASCYLMINLIQSQTLGAPPYNFSPANVGYTNLAFFVGVCISLLTAGPLSDWVSQRATVRNNGVREPEMRLPALLPFAVCTIIGSVTLSVGFQNGWPWEVIVIVGFTLIGIQVAAVSGIAITYVVDCYKPAAGEFLVCATVFKNVWGYGLSKFLNDWIVEIGYIGPLMTIAALSLGCMLLGAVPLYFYGKKLRGWSAGSSVHSAS
ncbi:MFS general substrate transporter, partial [Aureobasidium melanogenum]